MHVQDNTEYIYLSICVSYRRDSDGKMYVKYEVIGANSVAVPTHFFKVIVAETADQKLDMEAYVMPNQVIDNSTPLTVFQVCGTQL
jgi:endonuclease G